MAQRWSFGRTQQEPATIRGIVILLTIMLPWVDRRVESCSPRGCGDPRASLLRQVWPALGLPHGGQLLPWGWAR
jgi:hypothetical protein